MTWQDPSYYCSRETNDASNGSNNRTGNISFKIPLIQPSSHPGAPGVVEVVGPSVVVVVVGLSGMRAPMMGTPLRASRMGVASVVVMPRMLRIWSLTMSLIIPMRRSKTNCGENLSSSFRALAWPSAWLDRTSIDTEIFSLSTNDKISNKKLSKCSTLKNHFVNLFSKLPKLEEQRRCRKY